MCAVIPIRNTRYTGEITDERFYGRRLATFFREADLETVETFSYGAVPNIPNRVPCKALPPLLFDALQDRFEILTMSQAIVGRSRKANGV